MSPTALDEPAAAVRRRGVRARVSALPRRTLLINIGLAVLLIVVLVIAFLSLGPRRSSDADVRTVAVTRGTVTAKVTGTGNAASSVSTPVSFPTPGVLTAVDVQAGDTVARGQILATIDAAAARETLRTAQAQLANARAALDQAAAGPTDVKAQQDQLAITQAQQGVGNANATLGTAQHQRELDDASTATAITNAKTQLANDRTAQDNAVNAATISENSACTTATATAASATPTATATTSTSSCDSAKQSTRTARDNRDAVIDKDQQAITTAEQNRTATLAKDDATIQTNRQQVTTAQGQVDTARLTQQAGLHPQTPAQIAQARASVDSAQVQVDTARRTVDQTTLVAPQDGVVLAVNGKVGETSSSGAAATSGGGTTGAATGAASAASAATTSAGSGFIVIANLSKLAVTADIAEADAAKIKLGQAATVTFPGTGTTAPGSVTQITPQSTVTNNVVLYPITVSLDSAPSGVAVGATADISITTGTAGNVLQVPTAAITTVGSRHTVTIRRDGAQTVVPVQTGVSGDTVTEITGGLTEGEQLVLPSGVATVTGGFPGAGRQNGGGG